MRNDHIMKINEDKPSEEEKFQKTDNSTHTVKVFTIQGQQDDFDENGYPLLHDNLIYNGDTLSKIEKAEDKPKAYAYKNKNVYYVKIGPDGKMFNPIGMFTENMQAKINQVKGRMDFRWVTVTKSSFDFYLKFLKTRNISYLLNAERESL